MMRSAITAVIRGVMKRKEFEKSQPLAIRKALATPGSGAWNQDLSGQE